MDTFIMDKFIHRENLALFKKLIAEADMRREILVKLLADEEAKDEGGGTVRHRNCSNADLERN